MSEQPREKTMYILDQSAEIEALRSERDELKLAYAECSRQRNELLNAHKKLSAMTKERDALEADNKEILREWKEAARTHNSSMDSMYKALAASQAREQQLRDALETCDVGDTQFPDDTQFYDRKKVDDALALPHDDTALRQWGAKLLRGFANDYCWDAKNRLYYRDELRRKADELSNTNSTKGETK